MPVYSTKSRLKAEEIVKKALERFGENGLKLEVIDQSDCCVRFQGGGGHIDVYTEPHDGKTEVRIETREWDRQVKQFFEKL
jgi:hypothetical protein